MGVGRGISGRNQEVLHYKKNVAKEYEDGLMTGTRLLSIQCRENDIHKIPYCVRVNGAVGLVSVSGRPPKCFRCNEIGHRRECVSAWLINFQSPCGKQGECPNAIAGVGRHAYLRS